jgi:repressor LexA
MMLDVAMIVPGLKKTGKSKGRLAEAMGVRAGADSEILSGIRLIKVSEVPIITDYSN